MGVEPDSEEANNALGNDKTTFEGIDFDSEPDVGIADEGENEEIGLGAIVAGIQVVDEENENLDHDYEEVLLGNVLVDEEEAPSEIRRNLWWTIRRGRPPHRRRNSLHDGDESAKQ